MFNVFVLLYGDYPNYAHRCLSSLRKNPDGHNFISSVHVACNDISATTYSVLNEEIDELVKIVGCEVTTYESIGNIYKYPIMHKMFYQTSKELPGSHYMWFDDDSYITSDTFWEDCAKVVTDNPDVAMFGQIWKHILTDKFHDWVERQSWCNKQIERSQTVNFCQGAWWILAKSIQQRLAWPNLELRHCGGDSLLGMRLKHAELKMLSYDKGVAINRGRGEDASDAARRGYSEKCFAHDYAGQRYSVGHHNFGVRICKH
jgi:hypothetical protein